MNCHEPPPLIKFLATLVVSYFRALLPLFVLLGAERCVPGGEKDGGVSKRNDEAANVQHVCGSRQRPGAAGGSG